jgi:hypothetical protein
MPNDNENWSFEKGYIVFVTLLHVLLLLFNIFVGTFRYFFSDCDRYKDCIKEVLEERLEKPFFENDDDKYKKAYPDKYSGGI